MTVHSPDRPTWPGRGDRSVPGAQTDGLLLQREGKQLLGHDVPGCRRRDNRLDPPLRPPREQACGVQSLVLVEREEKAVPRAPRPSPSAPESLQERRDGTGRPDLDYPGEIADVDSQLESGGCHDHAVTGLGECLLGACRSEADNEECEVRVDVARTERDPQLLRSATAVNTSRFSPQCSLLITVAAPSIEPTWSSCTSRTAATAAGATTWRGRSAAGPCSQVRSSSGLPTVAESPTRCSGRPARCASRSRTCRRCQPA